MNLKELINSDYDTQNTLIATYAELRMIRDHRAHSTQSVELRLKRRIIRKLLARKLIRPYGEYDCKRNQIIPLDSVLYSIPRSWPATATPRDAWRDKLEDFLGKRRARCESYATYYFPLRRISSVRLDVNISPQIETCDDHERKYSRATHISVPTNWMNHAVYSTNEFLVLKRHNDTKEIEGMTVCTVSGWWKADIKGTRTHYPTTAFLAYSGDVRTITRSERTAIQGLRVRLTNQVMKRIAA